MADFSAPERTICNYWANQSSYEGNMNWTKLENGNLSCGPFEIRIDQYGAASLFTMHSMGTRNKRDIEELKQIASKLVAEILITVAHQMVE